MLYSERESPPISESPCTDTSSSLDLQTILRNRTFVLFRSFSEYKLTWSLQQKTHDLLIVDISMICKQEEQAHNVDEVDVSLVSNLCLERADIASISRPWMYYLNVQ